MQALQLPCASSLPGPERIDTNVLASFRFYAELNDFLPPTRRHVVFEHTVAPRTAVKDVIESLGVPHTEIDLILVDAVSVDFSAQVRDGDRISVYPVFESIDIAALTRLRPESLRHLRFVLDAHLGRLAAHLRLAGFRNRCCRLAPIPVGTCRLSHNQLRREHHDLVRNSVRLRKGATLISQRPAAGRRRLLRCLSHAEGSRHSQSLATG